MRSHLTNNEFEGGIAEKGDKADEKQDGWHSHTFGRSLSICFDLSDLAGSKRIRLGRKRDTHFGAVLTGKLHAARKALKIDDSDAPTEFAECSPRRRPPRTS